jgi:hypothetical protein
MSEFHLLPRKSFHVDYLDPEEKRGRRCETRLMVFQETNYAAICRRCAAPVVVRIRLDDRSWGSTYCTLHARIEMEALLAEGTAKLEEKEQESVTVQES